jgi:hypothetical protein
MLHDSFARVATKPPSYQKSMSLIDAKTLVAEDPGVPNRGHGFRDRLGAPG